MGWTLGEILEATGGKVARPGRLERYGEIVTDSKKVKRNSIFVALKGERHDAHRFVGDAVRRGAACVVVHRALAPATFGVATAVRVTDTLRALGDLAHYRREKLAPKVLAITGSNGKTTTKEMVAAIMAQGKLDGQPLRDKVLKTEGNFNNLVGLPLTLLRLNKKHRVAVVELGTNRPGEIQRLAEIADPDLAVITSVAAAHLAGLKSLAGVAQEKGALYRNLRPHGIIAVNLDDPWVRRLAAKFSGKKLTYGAGGHLRARSLRFHAARGMVFELRQGSRKARIRLNYLGRHNVTNALGAAALALAAGVDLAAVRRGLAQAKPFTMRMQQESWRGVGIVNDSYNANPGSMKAALDTLMLIGGRGRKIAVLGDMFELGNHSGKEHRALGRIAAQAKIDQLYLLGEEARQVRNGALGAGMKSDQVIIGADHSAIARSLLQQLRRGDWLLVKGSRGMKMEKILQELKSGKAQA
jgi:UDP-N-acetylmuramoyl-tripeptide--D-alanyl-D-alanine ligase